MAETQQNSVATQGNEIAYESSSWGARSCEVDAKQFTKCLDENRGEYADLWMVFGAAGEFFQRAKTGLYRSSSIKKN